MRTGLFYLVIVVSLLGCGLKDKKQFHLPVSAKTGILTAEQAGQATYRYAFSGQIINGISKTPIEEFSISMVEKDSAVSVVINALGDSNGLFHISRSPSMKDPAFSSLPIVISAYGYQPVFQMIGLGADCQAGNCAGVKPTPFYMTPLTEGEGSESTQVPLYFPEVVTQITAEQGTSEIFKQLVASGKLDLDIQRVLLSARNNDILNNVLVQLNGNSGDQTAELIGSLLGSINEGQLPDLSEGAGSAASILIPLLVSSNPEAAAALVAIQVLLPYLTPMMGEVLESGPMAQVLQSILNDPNSEANILQLVNLLQGGNSQSVQFAMMGFLPFISLPNKSQPSEGSFEKLLSQGLKDDSLYALFQSIRNVPQDDRIAMMVTYLQPLIQGLSGKKAPELAYLFNQLLFDNENRITAIKNFPKNLDEVEKYAKLIPYVEPMVRGLNGKDAVALAEILSPILSQKNPASVIRDLIEVPADCKKKGSFVQVLSNLYPSLQPLVDQGFVGKQVFAAQLLQGLLGGEFKGMQITGDLKVAPAIILSGRARDIFKIAQLPNVARLMTVDSR